ncbi:hypothetical protein LBMAG56_43270 [Verrucomicrobiota bacterium]|nr:hypothetical protein LBMAG56_43270 [Verrucomicrobiota bacterium]
MCEEQEEGGEEEGFHGMGVGGVKPGSGTGFAAMNAKRRKEGWRGWGGLKKWVRLPA